MYKNHSPDLSNVTSKYWPSRSSLALVLALSSGLCAPNSAQAQTHPETTSSEGHSTVSKESPHRTHWSFFLGGGAQFDGHSAMILPAVGGLEIRHQFFPHLLVGANLLTGVATSVDYTAFHILAEATALVSARSLALGLVGGLEGNINTDQQHVNPFLGLTAEIISGPFHGDCTISLSPDGPGGMCHMGAHWHL